MFCLLCQLGKIFQLRRVPITFWRPGDDLNLATVFACGVWPCPPTVSLVAVEYLDCDIPFGFA